ncbi:CoA transferase [Mesobacillus foraminis]|uniref:CaiB/BaiF CoA transferase family protein n=1 Tax=Mesobacillus foraminis TaxID=279826 RepID=UPI001BE5CE2C|nr:CaiB/BaiF CoA-transferase family protein [Mesobacillus foraminis]MBT2757788.1 CoA transferase [Mesobacillus foraminis]
MRPLEGILVLDFSQFLAGPSAALRLADLGARVIKIERPQGGDLSRQLYLNNLELDGDSILFHTINRNKESYAADLKNDKELEKVKQLICQADILIENFRPGTMEKLGLGYEEVKNLNPRLVYGYVSGYGKKGPWRNKPGQDLLVQSLSGLPWLNGNGDQPPIPFALSIADMMTGAHLVQGLLAALVRRGKTGMGGLVEVSLMESTLDFQFEVLSTFLNDGGQAPVRSSVNNANAYLGAPYGIYETTDGYLALAMGSVPKLGELLGCLELLPYTDQRDCFEKRDEIKSILASHLKDKPTKHWLEHLEPADYWCAEVMNWDKLMEHEGFRVLDIVQEIIRPNGRAMKTTRCPITINGERLNSSKWAPKVGEDNGKLEKEFSLGEQQPDGQYIEG